MAKKQDLFARGQRILAGWSVWREKLTKGKHKGAVEVRIASGEDADPITNRRYLRVTQVEWDSDRALIVAMLKAADARPELFTAKQKADLDALCTAYDKAQAKKRRAK